MEGHGSGTGAGIMILRNDSSICGAEHALTDTHSQTAEKDEPENSAGKPRKEGRRREDKGTHPNLTAAAQTVGIIPGKRHRDGIENIEQHGQKAHRTVRGSQVLLYLRKHDIESLAVRLVQEKRHPEQENNLPLIKPCLSINSHVFQLDTHFPIQR